MSFRVFFLCLLPCSWAWSAGVSIELDTAVSVDQFEYQGVDSVDHTECLLQPVLPIVIADDLSWTIQKTIATPETASCSSGFPYSRYDDGNNLFLLTKSGEYLYEHFIDRELSGNLEARVFSLPETPVQYGYFLKMPFIMTETGEILLKNSENEEWTSAHSVMDIPVGRVAEVIGLGSYLLVSIVESIDAGSWLISDGDPVKLSSIPFETAEIFPWSEGFVILDNSIEGLNAIEFTSSGHREEIEIENITKLKVRLGEQGGVIALESEDQHLLLWKGVNDTEIRSIPDPAFATAFKGCLSNKGRLFCIFKMKSGIHNIFELKRGSLFLHSTIFSPEVSDESIYTGFKVVGQVIELSIFNRYEDGTGYSFIYEINGDAQGTIARAANAVGFFYESPESNIVYWIAQGADRFQFSRLEFNWFDVENAEDRGLDSEDDEREIPRAELSGTLSWFILINMLLLLSVRRLGSN